MKTGILVLIILCLLACGSTKNKLVLVENKCGEIDPKSNINDVLDDMNFFIRKLELPLREKNIKLEINNNSRFCGFVLINDNKKKIVEGITTDSDLLCIMADFYKIKDFTSYCPPEVNTESVQERKK